MAVLAGARGTVNIAQELRDIDMSDSIALLDPSATPLTTLTQRLSSSATGNPKFSWDEDDLEPRFDTQNGGATLNATTVAVNNADRFNISDVVKNTRTGENFLVTALPGSGNLTVVRGLGNGGTGIAMLNADELYILGGAQPEGDTSRPAHTTNPTQKTNYTQIIRTPWEMTGTLMASRVITKPHDWAYQANKKGIEHKKSRELVSWFGKANEDSSGTQPRRTTGGVFSFITTNVTAVGGALGETAFLAAMRAPFRFGSKRKVLFASQLVVSVLQTYPKAKMQVIQSDSPDTYGLNVRRFVHPDGELSVVTNFLFEGTGYGGHAVGLDLDQVKRRYLANDMENRDTKIKQNIQANDADTRKDEYFEESGLQFGLEKTHFVLTGITG